MSVVQDLSARGLGAHETGVGDLGVQEVDMIMDKNEKGVHAAGKLSSILDTNCSLSLWRVARGSKLMRLELIHGLFIT
jgi:hypothetical protein